MYFFSPLNFEQLGGLWEKGLPISLWNAKVFWDAAAVLMGTGSSPPQAYCGSILEC